MKIFKITTPWCNPEFDAVNLTKKLANKLLPGFVVNAPRNKDKIYAIAKYRIYVEDTFQLVIVHRSKFWEGERKKWHIIKRLDVWDVDFADFLNDNKLCV